MFIFILFFSLVYLLETACHQQSPASLSLLPPSLSSPTFHSIPYVLSLCKISLRFSLSLLGFEICCAIRCCCTTSDRVSLPCKLFLLRSSFLTFPYCSFVNCLVSVCILVPTLDLFFWILRCICGARFSVFVFELVGWCWQFLIFRFFLQLMLLFVPFGWLIGMNYVASLQFCRLLLPGVREFWRMWIWAFICWRMWICELAYVRSLYGNVSSVIVILSAIFCKVS